MSREYVRGPPCGVDNCPSKTYFVADDGAMYCRNNHKQADYVTQDSEMFSGAASKKVRKQREVVEQESMILQGREAIPRYLKCLQQVLWKQVHWLVNVKKYPPELESVVRDLWAIRLTLVPSLGDDTFQTDQVVTSQLFSSQSSAEETSDEEIARTGLWGRLSRARHGEKLPKIVDTISLCYMGLLILRHPVRLGDVCEWVSNEDFVFVNALESIPAALRHQLPVNLRQYLVPRAGTKDVRKLHPHTMNLAASYKAKHGMTIPPINHILMLFRYIIDLSLPLETILAVHELKNVLGLSFTFYDNSPKKIVVSDVPELRLVALMVFVVKVLYPFDQVKRTVTKPSEIGALTVDWNAWNEIEERSGDGNATHHHRDLGALGVTEEDVFNMDETEMDKYLSWFQRNWIDAEPRSRREAERDDQVPVLQGPLGAFWRDMFSLFPLEHVQGGNKQMSTTDDVQDEKVLASSREQRIQAVQSTLVKLPLDPGGGTSSNPQTSSSNKGHFQRKSSESSTASSDEDGPGKERVLRVGEAYTQFRSVDDIPPLARPFFNKVAALAGVDLGVLVLALWQIESKCQRWGREQRPSSRRSSTSVPHAEESTTEDAMEQ